MPISLPRPRSGTIHALCAIPPLAAFVAVLLFGVDVLRWDEWMVWINLLERLDSGTLSFGHLIAQQNEQRLLFARLLGLLHMELFDLNRFPEFFTNLALAGLACLSLVHLYRATARRLGREPSPLIVLGLAALCFSLLQWDGFTQGINNVLFVMALFLSLGGILMSGPRIASWHLGLAILLGVAASFNFANALFYWFVLFPLIWTSGSSRRFKVAASCIWIVVAACVWTAYFTDYMKPPHHPALTDSLLRPDKMIAYFLTYLGGPLSSDKATLWPLATLLGSLGLLLWAACFFSLWRSDRGRLRTLAPWFALAAFGVLSGMSTSLGRSSLGLTQALESRYVTFGNFFWLPLLPVAWATDFSSLPGRLGKRIRGLLPSFAVLCCGVFVLSTILCVVILHKRHAYLTPARAELFTLMDDEKMATFFPDPAFVTSHLKPFYDKRLSVYRSIPRFEDMTTAALVNDTVGMLTTLDHRTEDGRVHGMIVSGEITPSDRLPDWIIITADGKDIFASDVDMPEEDGPPSFTVFIPSSFFEGDRAEFAAWAVYDGDDYAYRLEGGWFTDIPDPWSPPPTVDNYFLSR